MKGEALLVLGFGLYLDLRRGWRITSPNLEQTGLLRIEYADLDAICAAEDIWEGCHEALARATPAQRLGVCRVLLNWLRRELAIKVDYLDGAWQERLIQVSSQRLRPPWALDESELPEHATVAYPRSRKAGDYGGDRYLSARGAFGQYLRRPSTFPVGAGSSHDQWYFRRQGDMVAGVVAPPRLDLANEDLVRAHVHALWLSATGLSLRSSLTEILDVAGDHPTLALGRAAPPHAAGRAGRLLLPPLLPSPRPLAPRWRRLAPPRHRCSSSCKRAQGRGAHHGHLFDNQAQGRGDLRGVPDPAPGA